MFFCYLLNFFKLAFSKQLFIISTRVANSLDPDPDPILNWIHTVCKGYQQMALVGKGLSSSVNFVKDCKCVFFISCLSNEHKFSN